MPTGLQRQRDKARKAVLTPDEVARLLAAARDDLDKGVYYAMPFLTGTRPSEQLGLMWDDVDFEANIIRIRRIQLRYGSLSEITKTAAGGVRFRCRRCCARCCSRGGSAARVRTASLSACSLRPAASRLAFAARGGGGPLVYGSFRKRYWGPMLKRLGLPPVTPHCARHFVHFGAAGAGRRGGARRQAGWAQERRRDAEPLYPRDARRGRRGEGARQGICGKRVIRGDGKGVRPWFCLRVDTIRG